MKKTITFRHMESSDALKEHAFEKIDRLKKYAPDTPEAHIILSFEGNSRHFAEVNYSAKNLNAVGKSETADMYASIDEAVGKVEKTIRRNHDKKTQHK